MLCLLWVTSFLPGLLIAGQLYQKSIFLGPGLPEIPLVWVLELAKYRPAFIFYLFKASHMWGISFFFFFLLWLQLVLISTQSTAASREFMRTWTWDGWGISGLLELWSSIVPQTAMWVDKGAPMDGSELVLVFVAANKHGKPRSIWLVAGNYLQCTKNQQQRSDNWRWS